MSSLYAQYIREREGKEIIESKNGFVTYSFHEDNICYIEDIYVVPDKRHTYIAVAMADKVIEVAKENECKLLVGSVDTTLSSMDSSVQVLYGYGMRFSHIDGNMIYFKKEI